MSPKTGRMVRPVAPRLLAAAVVGLSALDIRVESLGGRTITETTVRCRKDGQPSPIFDCTTWGKRMKKKEKKQHFGRNMIL